MQLLEICLSYGYFAEPSKSTIIVKEHHLQDAKDTFCDLQLEAVLANFLLAGSVGDDVGILLYVSGTIDIWVRCSELLAGATRPSDIQPMLHSYILSRVSGHTFSGLWKALMKSIAICAMPSIRFSLQPCLGERSYI